MSGLQAEAGPLAATGSESTSSAWQVCLDRVDQQRTPLNPEIRTLEPACFYALLPAGVRVYAAAPATPATHFVGAVSLISQQTAATIIRQLLRDIQTTASSRTRL